MNDSHPPTAPAVLRLGLFLLLGTGPVAFVTWHNLSELFAGRPHTMGLLLTALMIPVAVLLIRALARTVTGAGRRRIATGVLLASPTPTRDQPPCPRPWPAMSGPTSSPEEEELPPPRGTLFVTDALRDHPRGDVERRVLDHAAEELRIT